MQRQDKINIIYALVGKGKELTTKELINTGLSNVDLTRFTKEKVLIRTEKGKYQIDKNELLNIATKLIANNRAEEAIKYLEQYYKIDKSNHEVLMYLFNDATIKEDYDKIFTIINDIYDKDEQTSNSDFNFYLLLLKKVTELPVKFKEKAEYITHYDIEIKDRKIDNVDQLNRIRSFVMNNNMPLAKQENTKLMNEKNIIEYQLVNNLIDNILRERNKGTIKTTESVKPVNYSIINKYIQNKEYDKLKDYLESNKENLNKNAQYLLKVCEALLNIKNTSNIPSAIDNLVQNVFDAIDNSNYKLALQLSIEYNRSKNMVNETNSMYLMLKDINNEIDKINNAKEKNINTTKLKPQIEEVKQVKNIIDKKEKIVEEIKDDKTAVNYIIDIISYLLKEDLDSAFKSLKSYLNLVNKKQYEFLVIDLIKLSIIEKDKAYTKAMSALNYLSRENFDFEISEYIEAFYKSLLENKFNECKIYLDILRHAHELGQNCFLINELEKILENTEKLTNREEGNSLTLKA